MAGALIEVERVCTSCGRTLPITAFYRHARSRGGRRRQCGECVRRYLREHPPEPTTEVERTCRWCGETKPITAFPVDHGYRRRECQACITAQLRDRERVRAQRRVAV